MSKATAADLKVCADPDATPSSDRAERGFDNAIARLLARELGERLVYEWQRNGRGFVRDVVNKGKCDVVLGVPTDFRGLATTKPYYRSAYVFVTRRARGLHLASFDDPALRKLKIGVQTVGEEYAPPGEALGRRGLGANIVSFSGLGARGRAIIDAVATKKVDAAIVWGPTAGYWARRYSGQLEITPAPERDGALPLAFSMSLGVRKSEPALRDKLNVALERRAAEIERILKRYGVPLLSAPSQLASGNPATAGTPPKGGH